MPRKTYAVEHLGCANCAAKMEEKMNRLPGVEAVLVFTTRQLHITADDPDALLPQLQAIVSSIEADARIVQAGHEAHCDHDYAHGEHRGCGHEHGEHCGCGHDHEHGEHCGHNHTPEHGHSHDHEHGQTPMWPLAVGAGLFLLGLLTGGIPALQLGLCVGAYLLLGLPVLKTAGNNLLRGYVFDENFLMSLATLGAFAIGEFPEAVGVMLFYRVGEFFEARAVQRSRSQIMEAVDLRPETVLRLEDGVETVIAAADARVGDTVLVRPGDRIPLDGTVLTGSSRLDTAPITGESVPVAVGPGETVVSGCVNLAQQLTVRVEKPLSESMVSRILQAVESAAARKPRIDRFITRFARVYTPAVVAIAALTAVIPSLVDGRWGHWVYTALSFLVMSCPCALVLSVPLAFFSGIGVGSRKGILFKGGASMEALAGIRAVAMDKTGTLTRGEFKVQAVQGGEILALCAACEQHSTHPIAVSITAAAREQGLALPQPEALEEIPGHGIRGRVMGREVLCGNARLLEKFGVALPEILPENGGTLVLAAVDGVYAGYLIVADALKPESADTVRRLQAMGLQTAMLTGDNRPGAEAVAREAGIHRVHAQLLPQQKLQALQAIRESWGPTLFVGDGINDAPVLAGADVGAAMGSGADAAIEAADVVFLTSRMDAVADAVALSRRTRAVAWQNVVFALGVKAAVMVLGLCGVASMWLAVFADSGVAMLCVLNSVRMLMGKKNAGCIENGKR